MIEVFKKMVEALECALSEDKPYIDECRQAIQAGKQAIAELESQEQGEPVAEARFDGTLHWLEPYGIGLHRFQGLLYTHPPQRTWVGLTDEEISMFSMWLDSKPDATVFTAIEARLKEINT